jgi:hypothetical protein
MAIPGFMAELSLERSITNHHGKKEYESINDRMLFPQDIICSPGCTVECAKSPFNDEKCYRQCVRRDCSFYYVECNSDEPCVQCCPQECVRCPPPPPPPPPPPCTPGCGPCINGIRHCYTEQCLGYAMACNVQPL